jgi:hypothetical protein
MEDFGSAAPPGAIPIDQFEAAPASPQAHAPMPNAMPPVQSAPEIPGGLPPGAIPVDQFESLEDTYSTPAQKGKAFAEGLAAGVAGPLYPAVMRATGLSSPEDYLGREEANPWTKGGAEVVGIVGSTLIPMGQGAAMAKAGRVAQEVTGLTKVMEYERALEAAKMAAKAGDAAAPALKEMATLMKPSYGHRVGSSVVNEAAQMAVYQSGHEASRMIMGDPDTSAETAIANVGLATVLGGLGGAAITGVASPLWDATVKEPIGKSLKWLRGHLDGPEGNVTPIKNYAGVEVAVEAEPKNALKLVHYSPKELDMIDPSFSGTGVDSRTRNRMVEEKFSHYYVDGAEPEDLVKQFGKNKHEVVIDLDKHKIYDYGTDEQKIIQQVKDANNGVFSLDEASKLLKSKGFAGFKTSADDTFKNNIHLFDAHKVRAVNGVERSSANAAVRSVADEHAALKGITLDHKTKLGLNTERATEIAKLYDGMKHDPTNPEVQKAYSALIKETLEQYEAIKKTGLKVTPIQPGQPNPYRNSQEMADDIAKNNHLFYFPTTEGFGQVAGAAAANADHPMLQYTKEVMNGQPMQANDIFRIVHDYFGHAKEGLKFGARGEENAWYHHAQMYSPEARRALTTETRGQNSWVNFGPHGAANKANPGPSLQPGMVRGAIPPHVQQAANELGIEVPDIIKGFLSDDPRIRGLAEDLRVAQHPEVMKALTEFRAQLHEAVERKTGMPLEDLAQFSQNEAGHETLEKFLQEFDQKVAPIAADWEKRQAIAATIDVPDETRRDFGGHLIERGMKDFGTDSPYYKIYEEAAQRIYARDTIGGLDKYKAELSGKISRMATDHNEQRAYKAIRDDLTDFMEREINKQSVQLEKEGAEFASAIGRDIVSERRRTSAEYREFAQMAGDLLDHLGAGSFHGAGSLREKLKGLSAEQIVSKFSPRGNVDFIPFLAAHFPDTLDIVRQNELRRIVAPSVVRREGELLLDFNKLSKAIEQGRKGAPEYVQFALPQELVSSVESAKVLSDTIAQKVKDSGTPGGLGKIMKHMPASALAAVGLMSGHNPISSYLIGEMAQRLGKNAPEAIKLAYMKFLSSGQPVEAKGFRAMVELMDQAIKGETALQQGTKAIFKASMPVIAAGQMPDDGDREKLDKAVDKFQKSPEKMMPKEDDPSQDIRLGHYMPEHEQAVVQAQTRALQYLTSIKPQPHQLGPLDPEVPPTPAEVARYNRALDIATTPNMVLEHIKQGTLQPSDIQDLQNMYPGLYKNMVQKLTNQVADMKSNDELVPYKTRVSISLFLGQPLDGSMAPAAIQAAQPQPQGAPAAPNGKTKVGANAAKAMGNNADLSRTQSQDAEVDRSKR